MQFRHHADFPLGVRVEYITNPRLRPGNTMLGKKGLTEAAMGTSVLLICKRQLFLSSLRQLPLHYIFSVASLTSTCNTDNVPAFPVYA